MLIKSQGGIFSQNYFKSLVLFVLLIVYDSLASIDMHLTPLLGVILCYVMLSSSRRQNNFLVLLFFLYTVFMEADRGYVIFSFLIFFLIFYPFFRTVVKILSNKITITIALVIICYVGYYLTNSILGYFLGDNTFIFNKLYAYFILQDIALSLIFVRVR